MHHGRWANQWISATRPQTGDSGDLSFDEGLGLGRETVETCHSTMIRCSSNCCSSNIQPARTQQQLLPIEYPAGTQQKLLPLRICSSLKQRSLASALLPFGSTRRNNTDDHSMHARISKARFRQRSLRRGIKVHTRLWQYRSYG